MDRREWDARYAAEELVWSAGPNRFLAAEAADLTPGTALDVACGEGRNAIWLAERGWQVTGIDFSQVALEKASRLAEARGVRVAWVLADITRDASLPGEHDLVAVCYLHLPTDERRRVFARAADAVAPDGTLLVIGHDSTNPTQGWGGPRDSDVLYGPDDVVADIGGLQVVKAERVRRPVVTEDGDRTAIDVLVRATRPP